MMAQLDKNTKLRSQTDEDGRFVFSEVPAGTYVLVFDRRAAAHASERRQRSQTVIL
jgi:hypothetical protein